MKASRALVGYGLFVVVALFGYLLYKLIDTGWVANAGVPTLLIVSFIVLYLALLLWRTVSRLLSATPKE